MKCQFEIKLNIYTHNICSKTNASYFMLAHNIGGQYWWYCCRGWTSQSTLCYILLPRDGWQQRGSLTKWCLTLKCLWSRGVSLNSSMWKKTAYINIYQCLLNAFGEQTVDFSTGRWMVCFSSGDTNVKDKPHSRQPHTHSWCRFCMITACRLFIAGENAQLVVVEKFCFVADSLLYQMVLVYSF